MTIAGKETLKIIIWFNKWPLKFNIRHLNDKMEDAEGIWWIKSDSVAQTYKTKTMKKNYHAF